MELNRPSVLHTARARAVEQSQLNLAAELSGGSGFDTIDPRLHCKPPDHADEGIFMLILLL